MQGARTVMLLGLCLVLVIAAGLWLGLRDGDTESKETDEQATPPRNAAGGSGEIRPPEGGDAEGVLSGRLTGRLVVLATGKPAPNVVVSLSRPGAEEPVAGEATDAAGIFVFVDVPGAEDYELLVSHGEYATIRAGGLVVAGGEVTDVGILYLSEAVTFTVEVLDGSGTPIPEATVELHNAADRSRRWNPGGWMESVLAATEIPTPLRTAKTGDDGRVEIADVPGGEYTILAEAEGFARSGVTRLLSAETVGEVVRIRLGRGYSLEGSVLDSDGEIVAGRVLASPIAAGFGPANPDRRSGTIDEAGTYRVDRLPPGPVSLMVDVEGAPPVWVGAVDIPRLKRFDIRLGEPSSLEGTVTDEAGGAIAGAEVRVMFQMRRGGAGAASVTTDAEGRFLLEGVASGSISRVEALADGYARYPTPADRRIAYSLSPGGRLAIHLVLRRGGELVGKVTRSGDGEGIGGARVTLSSRGGFNQISLQTTTGPDGSYRIAPLVAGQYTIAVQAAGYYSPLAPGGGPGVPMAGPMGRQSEQLAVLIEEGAARTVKDLELARGATVSGRVVDSLDQPVAGARLTVQPRGADPAYSGSDGSFEVVGVTPANGVSLTAYVPGRWARSDTFPVAEGQRVADLKLVLKAAASIRGTVVLSGDSPPTGGTVQAVAGRNRGFGFNPLSGGASAPIGADGSFLLEDVPPGELTVIAAVPGYPEGRSEVLQVPEGGEVTGVRVIISGGLAIRGRVTTKDGEPVEGASITFRSRSGGGLRSMGNWATVAQSDAGGNFEIDGVGEETYSVTASKTGFSPATDNSVDPAAGETVRLEMESTGEISGRVVDEAGVPVSGMTVALRADSNRGRGRSAGSATTGNDGTFRILGVQEGTYRLTVTPAWGSGRNFAADPVENVKVGDTVEVRVRAGFRIAGRVMDMNGRGLVGLPVRVRGGEPATDTWAQTGPDGRFEAAGLAAGSYDVTVQSVGGGLTAPALTGIAAGTENLVVTLRAGMEISGRVVGPDGAPVANIFLRAKASAGSQGSNRSARTDAEGRFTVGGLFPGTYDLTITASGRFTDRVVPGLSAGSVGVLVQLSTGESITGVAFDEKHQRLPGVVLRIDLGGGGNVTVTSNAKGEFAFGGLEVGREYEITIVSSASGHVFTGKVKVKAETGTPPEGKYDMEVSLSPGLSIRGRVVDSRGQAASGAWINVQEQRRGARTDSDGNFEIKGLSPGELEIQVFSSSGTTRATLRAGDQGVLIRLD